MEALLKVNNIYGRSVDQSITEQLQKGRTGLEKSVWPVEYFTIVPSVTVDVGDEAGRHSDEFEATFGLVKAAF
jgi:hypothetical protein